MQVIFLAHSNFIKLDKKTEFRNHVGGASTKKDSPVFSGGFTFLLVNKHFYDIKKHLIQKGTKNFHAKGNFFGSLGQYKIIHQCFMLLLNIVNI